MSTYTQLHNISAGRDCVCVDFFSYEKSLPYIKSTSTYAEVLSVKVHRGVYVSTLGRIRKYIRKYIGSGSGEELDRFAQLLDGLMRIHLIGDGLRDMPHKALYAHMVGTCGLEP